MKIKHLVLVIVACLIILSIHSCSKSSNSTTQPPSGGNTTTINISGMVFPASTTVKKGTTVTWHNEDGFGHTVTSDDGTSFNSGNLAASGTFSYQANTVGSFAYHCNVHSNMHGTLIVNP